MNCNDAQKLIDDMTEGRLGRAGSSLIREHCRDCAECKKAVDEAEALMAAVSDSFQSARPAKSNKKRIMSAVEAARRAPVRTSYWTSTPVIAVAAAAAAILLVVGIVAVRARSDSNRRRTAAGNTADQKAPTVVDDSVVERAEKVSDPVVDGDGAIEPVLNVADGSAPREEAAPEQLAAPEDVPPRAPAIALEEPVGAVVSGTFEIKRRGEAAMQKVQALTELRPGDTISLAGEAAGELTLSDRVTLAVDAGSKITIGDDPGKPFDLHLDGGRLFADVKTGTPFRVLTADGVVHSLGTKFGVSLVDAEEGGKELSVTVEEGTVEVEREQKKHLVRSGKCVSFRRGHGMNHCGSEGFERRMMWVHRFRTRHGHGHGPGPGPDHKPWHGKPGEGHGHKGGTDGESDRGKGFGGQRPGTGEGHGTPGRGRGSGRGSGRGGKGGRRR